MKYRIYLAGWLCALGITAGSFAVDLTITTTGIIQLGSNILSAPTSANDSAILIQSSDVILDLAGSIINQTNTTPGFIGIQVSAGLKNVTIMNGTILATTGTGVLINNNCSNITIQNMSILQTTSRGIEFAGTLANPINDCLITDCELLRLSTSGLITSGLAIGLLLTQCNRVIVNGLTINNGGITTGDFIGVRLDTSSSCDIQNVEILSNQGASFTGVDIIANSRNIFTNCSMRNNSSTSSGTQLLRGFNIGVAAGTTNYNLFFNCTVINNSLANSSATNSSNVTGFLLGGNATNNILQNCNAMGNSSSGTRGALVDGFLTTTGADQNSFLTCFAMANNAVGTSNDCNGFQITNASFGIMQNCISAFNTSGVQGRGLYFDGTVGTNWAIMNCDFSRNVGSSAANSFGVRFPGGTIAGNNLFTQCIGFVNNTTAANQLSGVPSAPAITAPATQNLTTSGAWSNLPIPA